MKERLIYTQSGTIGVGLHPDADDYTARTGVSGAEMCAVSVALDAVTRRREQVLPGSGVSPR
jgi:hypothetical protein